MKTAIVAALVVLTTSGCALNAYQRRELQAASDSIHGFDTPSAPSTTRPAQPAQPQTCTVQPQLGVRETYTVECQ